MESHLTEPTPPPGDAAQVAAAEVLVAEAVPAPPRPPRVWPIFVAWVAAHVGTTVVMVLAMIGWALALVARDPALRSDPQRVMGFFREVTASPWFLVGSAALAAVVLGATALVGARLSGEPLGSRLRLGPSRLSPGSFLVAVVAFVALGEAGSALLALTQFPLQGSLAWMTRLLAGLSGWRLAGALLSVGLLAGVGEELFFRGFMQTRFRQRWGTWPAVVFTAAAFGLAHLDPLHTPLAFGMGLFAGWLVERTGSLRPAMAGHVANNAVSVLLSAAWPDGVEAQLGAGLCLAVSLAALVAGLVVLRRVPAAPFDVRPAGDRPVGVLAPAGAAEENRQAT